MSGGLAYFVLHCIGDAYVSSFLYRGATDSIRKIVIGKNGFYPWTTSSVGIRRAHVLTRSREFTCKTRVNCEPMYRTITYKTKLTLLSVPSRKSLHRKIVHRQFCNGTITSDHCPHAQGIASTYVKSYDEVPGPRPIPILGNAWRLLPLIGQYQISDIAKISQMFYNEYGKIVRLGGLMGRPDLLFVYDADEIEKIYRQEGPTPFRPAMPCLVYYKSIVRKNFFGDLPGVVGVHGEPWKEFRTRVQKPVLQPQTVRKYITPIEVVTKDFIKRIEKIKRDDDELPADFDNEIHKWALECIGRVALDVRLGCLGGTLSPDSEPQKIIDAAKFALRNVAALELKAPYWRYIPTPLWSRYVRNMDYFVEICMKYIDAAIFRLKNKKVVSEDDLSLVERILANETDPKMAYIFALDLILVGIDTISMAVCSILYQLATRPEEQEKIHQELRQILPDPSVPLTTSHLDQAVYMKAFIREVFRVYSTVIGNGRTLQNDTVICGYKIPKGVQVVFPILITGNMEKYVADAKTFRPARWLKDANNEKLHPFASLPYGYGARMCLGRRFADLEMQVLLAKLLRSYKLEYHHKPLKYKVTFMYAPDGELKFKLIKR